MKKTTLWLLGFLLLMGCSDQATETETTEDLKSIDAKVLLASTLENAKASDKRVLVHLGAPW